METTKLDEQKGTPDVLSCTMCGPERTGPIYVCGRCKKPGHVGVHCLACKIRLSLSIVDAHVFFEGTGLVPNENQAVRFKDGCPCCVTYTPQTPFKQVAVFDLFPLPISSLVH